MNYSERLLKWIEINQFTKADMAKLLDISRQSLSNYLAAFSFPSKETLERLYNLGCSLNWLIAGEGSIFAENERGRLLKEKHELNEKSRELDKKFLNKSYEDFNSTNDSIEDSKNEIQKDPLVKENTAELIKLNPEEMLKLVGLLRQAENALMAAADGKKLEELINNKI